jgi:Cyclic nucleotide-binding domain/Major Facilitator Superfamily
LAVIGVVGRRLAEGGAALASNFRRPDLRRAQLAFGATYAGEWALTVALGVVAFRDGGATAVGIVALIRMLPSALIAPFATAVADRVRRDRVLIWIGVTRAAALGAAAVVMALDLSAVFVYVLALIATIPFTAFRPAHSALLPALCETPTELTAANASRGLLDSASILVGPLLAALLLGISGPEAVFVLIVGLSLWSALLVNLIDYEPAPRETPPAPIRIAADTADGLRAIAAQRDVTMLLGLAAVQALTRGALSVFTVVVAIELLETGEPGVGVLTAAVGIGAVVGSLGASVLVGSRRLAAYTGVGIVMWGTPLALIGVFPAELFALVMLAIVGAGNALVDLGYFTLFPRLMPDEVLARVFGALESLVALAVGLGSIITPLLIHLFGIRGALVAIGLMTPAVVALAWSRLVQVDEGLGAQADIIERLREVAMLRPLPVSTIEHLARNVREESVEPGETVIEQGQVGDSFYVIVAGEVEVRENGEVLRVLSDGDSFGEIALLRDVPRTMTVRARTPVALYALDGRHFVPTVSGYSESAAEAETVVETRLAASAARPV